MWVPTLPHIKSSQRTSSSSPFTTYSTFLYDGHYTRRGEVTLMTTKEGPLFIVYFGNDIKKRASFKIIPVYFII